MAEMNPFFTVIEMAAGYCLSRSLHTVAEFGIADALKEEPQTVADLATACGVNADALGRMLRLLSAYGVFRSEGDRFAHSPASELLRTDHPQSMRNLVRMFGFDMNWEIFGEMEHTLKTGRPAGEKVLPKGFWGYFAEHPEENSIFNAAMAGKAHAQVAAIISAYDFSQFKVIGDMGGGRGHLLHAILEAVPAAKGVLFDLPHVIQEVATIGSDRLKLQGGDFFKDRLPECDAYTMMEVIHDWNDEDSIRIFKAIRRSAPSHAKLLLIEQIVPTDPGPSWSKMLDIHMLTLLGGKQRTVREYESLLQRSGFSLQRQIDTPADISILEAIPVS
jgi:hypothetical protein